MNFFKKLINNNTGVSSKNFFLVTVTIIGCLLLLVPAVTLIVEIIFNHTITTSLEGFAAYIASIGTLFATVGVTKAWAEKYEQKQPQKFDEVTEEVAIPEEE